MTVAHSIEFNSRDRKKRLGQYFSGQKVARLLAALSNAQSSSRIIDTMAGVGDMLTACHLFGAEHTETFGIEIDPIAFGDLENAVGKNNVVRANAFDIDAYDEIGTSWDLAITNPPYIRYQSQNTPSVCGELKLPKSDEVRSGLKRILSCCSHLTELDHDSFGEVIDNYSGLADIALPSWILNSILLSEGGRLAVVLPESWLSRNYALPIKSILSKWFEIEIVVEDLNATWFPEAQVKTFLLIAKRVKRREDSSEYHRSGLFTKIQLSSGATDKHSLVGNIFPNYVRPEIKFAEVVNDCASSHKEIHEETYSISMEPASSLIGAPIANKGSSNISACQSSNILLGLPGNMQRWSEEFNLHNCHSNLDKWGVNVGQGLRTGANAAFYLDAVEEVGGVTNLKSKITEIDELISVPSEFLRPVLRRQSELNGAFEVPSKLQGRVLSINSKNYSTGDQQYLNSLNSYLRKVERQNFGTNENPKRIEDYSAVRSNIKLDGNGKPISHWFMLPKFADRHRPHLFIPRVNNLGVKAYVNSNRAHLVDANFSTLWVNSKSSVCQFAVLAILNSTWCTAFLECSASVMGGGALKVEATHLKQLPLPEMSEQSFKELSALGKMLVISKSADLNKALENINQFIMKAMVKSSNPELASQALDQIKSDRIFARQSQKKR